MTVCQFCNGAGAHQGVSVQVKDKGGNATHKKTDTPTGMASSPCQACGGTGILRSFGV